MSARRTSPGFLVANVVMWAAMTTILVLVPDTLERWMSMELARVLGWAVASGLWVVALQPPWRSRVGPVALFIIQVLLWVSAAILANWISDTVRMPVFMSGPSV